jgi:hypothetical protein
VNPNVASRLTREVFPANLPKFLRQVRDHPVGVEGFAVNPIDLGRRRIDQERFALPFGNPYEKTQYRGLPQSEGERSCAKSSKS